MNSWSVGAARRQLQRFGVMLVLAQICSLFATSERPPPHLAFWDDESLLAGSVVHNPGQFRPLLAKLEAGQPITVLAWGSSVTSFQGGCYSEAGIRLQELNGDDPQRCDRFNEPTLLENTPYPRNETYPWTGWGTIWMRWINETWPHPDHAFVNYGRGGCPLHCFTEAGCFMDRMPNPVDLVLMENLGGIAEAAVLERLFLMVIHRTNMTQPPGAPRPAILVINTNNIIVDQEDKYWVHCIVHRTCATECANDFQHNLYGNFWPGNRDDAHAEEAESFALASYYGADAVSLNHALHGLMRDGLLPSGGVGACERLALLYNDIIHLRQLGMWLLADLLRSVLQRARAHVRAHPDGRPPSTPPRPMTRVGGILFRQKCYMLGSVSEPRFEHLMDVARVPPEYLEVLPGSSGWRFVRHDLDQTHRRKPGIVAHTPGSTLRFRANVTLPSLTHGGELPRRVSAVVTYLASYTKRGKAQVTCLSGCACQPQVIDSYHGYPWSTAELHRFDLASPTPACEMEMTLLQETSSGGHAFKLLGVGFAA